MKDPIVAFADLKSMETYLSRNRDGFWLKIAKVGAPSPTISKAQAIEAALCYGWIDGQLATFDEHHFLVRMTPRRSSSRWSAKNKETARCLIREGRMQPSGLAEVEKAMADGRWDAAYLPQSTAEPAPDLVSALAKNARAARAFASLDRANRYAIIYRVNNAKRAQTRERRIREFVAMLARGETIHPVKPKA